MHAFLTAKKPEKPEAAEAASAEVSELGVEEETGELPAEVTKLVHQLRLSCLAFSGKIPNREKQAVKHNCGSYLLRCIFG